MLKTVDIAPGVRLVCVKTDKYKTFDINVSMALPLDENASANALLVKLLRRSCKAYPDLTAMNRRLSELYGASVGASVSKMGDAQILTISGDCLDDKFALDGESIISDFISLICEMIFNPNIKSNSFGTDNLAGEKRLLVQDVLEELDDKRTYAFNKCIEHMCENEPYGKMSTGTIEEIESTKMNAVYAAWKNLISTARIQITAVGNVTPKKIETAFKAKFKKIDRQPCEIETIFLKKPQRFARHEERITANQGKLVIGYRTGMENKFDGLYPEVVMINIFGGGTYSKLFTNIREKMSLAYYCSAMLIVNKGIAVVQSGIDTDKEKAVSAGVINQLNEIRSGKFDDELIASAKKSIREGLTFNSSDAICRYYTNQMLNENIEKPEDFIKGIDSVTKEQICEAAKKMVLDKIFMLSADSGEEAAQ